MSKPNKARYKLESVRPQYDEALDTTAGLVELEGTDGQVYTLEHPLFWSGKKQKKLQTATAQSEEAVVTVILGEEQAAKFLEAGESTDDLGLFVGALRAEMQEKAQEVRIKKG